MPRYFFHTDDEDGHANDVAGVELSDDDAAKQEAVQAFGEMLREAEEKSHPASWVMRVLRENGDTVCRLSLRIAGP